MKTTKLFALACCATILGLSGVAHGATIAVNTTVDGISAGDGFCTLREAVRNANQTSGGDLTSGDCAAGDPGLDEITVPAGIYLLIIPGVNEEYASTGDLDLRDSVRIVGAGSTATTIRGAGDRLFDIRFNTGAPITVELEALELELGDPFGSISAIGGAVNIVDPHELVVRDSRIADNTASTGGAVHSDGGTLTFDTVVFDSNVATGAGGAITTKDGTVTVVDCEFIGNSAVIGGAINASLFGTLDVVRTLFSGNSATGVGGALQLSSITMHTIDTSRFELNSSGDDGGAISTLSELTVSGSVFDGNTASDLGGAIWATDNVTLDGTTLLNHEAREGGAIHNVTGVLTITGSTLRDNEATEAGGAIANHDELAIAGSTLSGNVAATTGGAVSSTGPVTVDTTLIENNLAQDGGGMWFLFDHAETLEMNHSALIDNEATNEGGGWRNEGGLAKFFNTTISGNDAGVEGGAGYCRSNCDLDFATVANNHSPGLAGGIYNPFSDVTLKNSILGDNFPSACGGGGDFFSEGYNLVQSTLCNLSEPTDIQGLFPFLLPLADNGGPTPTHGLSPLSAAIDSADPTCDTMSGTAATDDQRLVTRPRDGDGDSNAICDRGAFEVSPVVIPPPVPDGTFGTGMKVDAVDVTGTTIDLTWDVSTCTGGDYHLVFGDLADVSLYVPLGGACDLGTAGNATGVDVGTGSLWFVVVADDDATIEGSWGQATGGERNPGIPSGGCGLTTRDDTGTCP